MAAVKREFENLFYVVLIDRCDRAFCGVVGPMPKAEAELKLQVEIKQHGMDESSYMFRCGET